MAPKALSAREKQVLKLFEEGKKLTEIADLLKISSNTVAGYLSRIGHKVGAKREDLAKVARQRGML